MQQLGAKISRENFNRAGGIKLPAGIEPEEWDAFCDYVVLDELNRAGTGSTFMGMVSVDLAFLHQSGKCLPSFDALL